MEVVITDMEEDRMNSKKFKLVSSIIGVLILSSLLLLMTFYFSTSYFDKVFFKSYLGDFRLLILNILPIILLMSLLTLVSNRLWLGFGLSFIGLFALSIGNKYKLIYRDEPVKFMDLKLLNESVDMAGKYEIKITLAMVLMLVAAILIALILRKFLPTRLIDGDSRKRRIIARVLGILLVILVGFGLYKTIYTDKELYAAIGDEEIINKFSQTQQFQSKGLVYPFVYSSEELKDYVLEDYDEDRAKELLAERKYEDIEEDKKVNIVSIMLESYNDFSKFDGVEFENDPYDYFHKLQKESISGNLITNVFGGGTINTEWSFLTGIYSHTRKYVSNTNSNVWYFRDQGYKTESMHPIYGWFYNRRNVNEYLGFENFDYYENRFEKIQEEFLEDYDFFDYVIEGYEKSMEESRPYFHFSVTYQNHGPYQDTWDADAEYLKKKDNYDSKLYNIINNYLSGINKTDRALEKMVEYYRKVDEPVVLVFFGDHNPSLGVETRGYDMLGIDMSLEDEESFRNYYSTPYIFWANDKAKEVLDNDFVGEGEEISPNFLMTELFKNLGYKGDEYMQYTTDLMDTFTVNHYMFFRQKGEYKRELEGDAYKTWREFNSLQYYYIRNFRYDNVK